MRYINLTPHPISVYNGSQFVNLVQINPTTWVADAVNGDSILSIDSTGVARISTSTKIINNVNGIDFYATTYGDIVGIPDDIDSDDILVVSLPTVSNAKASNHALANQLVSPWGVVRLASDPNQVLGCQGFTY
jgi:hypothetical protein